MRNAFASELLELARKDPAIVLLCGDMGNNLFNAFKKEFPKRFINCGAAEANMTGVACGMALAGLRPVTYSIAAFNPGRCAEQVRLDICLQNLPVIVVGVGSGFSYASLGPTHHSLEDIAWMRSLPNMAVVCPADALETRAALRAAHDYAGPVYLRLGKKNEPKIYPDEPEFSIGRAIILREGQDACILSTGTVLPLAMQAAAVLDQAGHAVEVTNMHSIKPLDAGLLSRIFASGKPVLVLEEHYAAGGLYSAIAEWLCGHPALLDKARLLRLGPDDLFYTSGGDKDFVRQSCGLDSCRICQIILKAIDDSGKKRPV